MNNSNSYPVNEEAVHRPFAIWHEDRKAYLRWRYYAIPRNAQIGGWIEAKYECKVSETLTIVDRRNGRTLGQYTHRVVNGVHMITFDPNKETLRGIKQVG